MAGIFRSPGQSCGKYRGWGWLRVLQFWGKGFSPFSLAEVPEPLYTKQPPQPGLNFREAVAEEAATRDFSMSFQVKSEAFQLCQETSPLSLSGCLLELGCRATA